MSASESEAPAPVYENVAEEMNAVIAKHLPAETVGVLRARLDRLSTVEGELTALERVHGTACAERDKFRNENHNLRDARGAVERREEEVTKREQACVLREEKCRHREEVIELKETHATERVGEAVGIVHAVFANNKFKYTERGTVPVPVEGMPSYTDSYGNAQPGYGGSVGSGEIERTVEGEGEPPMRPPASRE